MRDMLYDPCRVSVTFYSLLIQSVLLMPVSLFFMFWEKAHLYTGYSLGFWVSIIAFCVMAVLTLAFIRKTQPDFLSFCLPVSFALFPVILSMFCLFFSNFRTFEQLPYEWSDYFSCIGVYYTAPLVIISTLLTLGLKLKRHIKAERR